MSSRKKQIRLCSLANKKGVHWVGPECAKGSNRYTLFANTTIRNVLRFIDPTHIRKDPQ